MRRFGTVIALLLSLVTLSTFALAQTQPSPPGIRYAIGGSAGGINTLVVSKDGQSFASAGSDGTVKIWRMSDGTLLHTFVTPSAQPLCVALSPDGTTIAAGDSYERVWMWRLADDSIIRMFTAFSTSGVTSIAYSPDGTTLAAAGADSLSSGISYTIKLYSTSNGTLLETLDGHGNQITQIAYSPAGGSVLASASLDHTVRIWNTGTGQATAIINAFSAQGPTCLALSNDGTHVAAGGLDKKYPYNFAKVWNVVGGSQVVKINAYTSSAVTAVAFSPDGTMLATGGEDTVNGTPLYIPKTFSVPAGQLVNSFLQHNNTVQALVFSNDGSTLISGGLDYQIIQWNVSTGMPTNTVT
jgi:WD40 repeat protein